MLKKIKIERKKESRNWGDHLIKNFIIYTCKHILLRNNNNNNIEQTEHKFRHLHYLESDLFHVPLDLFMIC